MHPAICGRLAIALANDQETLAGAIQLAQDALERETYKRAGRYGLNFLLLGLGSAYLKAGQHDNALEMAHRVESLTKAAGEHIHHAPALALLAGIQVHTGATEDARSNYMAALRIAESSGMRPLAARCRLGLADLLETCGASADAQSQRANAEQEFRRLGIDISNGLDAFAGL